MIAKLFKKNAFIRKQFRKYGFRTKQPIWDSIWSTDKEIWESKLFAPEGKKKVLMATSLGSFLAGTTVESSLVVALTLRNVEVCILLCDEILQACSECWIDIYPNLKKFVKYGPKKDCNSCFEPAYKMYKSLGIKVYVYSDFISKDEIESIRKIALSVPYNDISNYEYENIKVGEHAIAGSLRFFLRGTLNGGHLEEDIVRRYLNAALTTTFVTNNLLDKIHFDSIVFHHGIYVPQGLIGEVCRKRKKHVVNWNPAYRKKCFIFSHDDSYHHTMITEPTDKWQKIKWNDDLEAKLQTYLRSRWDGSQDWIWFHEKPEFKLKKITDQLGIDISKPSIGLLTSVMWDAVLHYPSNAFSNMIEWVIFTIEYYIKKPEINLIIRVHPAEIHGLLPSRQRMVEEVKKHYPNLPPNIFIIPPDSSISTYALMSQCDSVIIYNTKTGIELSAIGLPVIVAGEAWIRNKGFSIDVEDKSSYLKVLDKLPLGKKLDIESYLKAKKYAFHFFFRRMIPLDFLEVAKGNPPFYLNLKSIQKLDHSHYMGLDIICDGILKKTDFIYPAEEK